MKISREWNLGKGEFFAEVTVHLAEDKSLFKMQWNSVRIGECLKMVREE